MDLTTGERIKIRRMELGMSAAELARRLDKNRSTIYRYESEEIENLPINTLVPLARALGVSPAYLLDGKDDTPVKKVPILGKIAAGQPVLASEEYCDYISVYDDLRVDFCLRVTGDSMIDACIHDGDLVFVRKQPTVENGEIAVVLIDDEATLKRFYRDGDVVMLKSENRKYEPMLYTARDFKDVRILGKAVMLQSLL